MAHEKPTAWDESQMLSMQVVAQVQGFLERFQVAIAQQIQQLGMQQQYHQGIQQQMLQQVLQQQQEQKALLQRSREEGPQPPTSSHWPQVYMQQPAGQHPALSKQPLLQLPPLLQSIPTASKAERTRKVRAKSQEEKLKSERFSRQAPGNGDAEQRKEKDEREKSAKEEKEEKDEKDEKEEKSEKGEKEEKSEKGEKEEKSEKGEKDEKEEAAEGKGTEKGEATTVTGMSTSFSECVSRIERCHEETLQKEFCEKEKEAEETPETGEAGAKESQKKETESSFEEQRSKASAEAAAFSKPRRGKTGPRHSEAERDPARKGHRSAQTSRGKMNQRSSDLQWRPRAS